jgi:hypothetical protein
MRLAILVALLVSSVPARAVPLVFDFSGRVQSVHADLVSSFAVGDAFNGTFTVDDIATSTSPTANGSNSTYAVSAFAVTFASSYSATSDVGGISVENNGDFGNPAIDQLDRYTLIISAGTYTSGPSVNGFAIGNFVFDFQERHAPPVSALLSSSLPMDPDGVLAPVTLNLQFDGFRNVRLGQVDIVLRGPAAAVPEPSTLLLVAAGLLGAAAARRRRAAD